MANMPRWQVGLLVAALTGGVTVACGGKDDNGGSSSSTGGAEETGGRGNEAGSEATTGGRDATGGRVGGGGDEATGGSGDAGEPATTGGAEATGGSGNAGEPATTGGAEATGGSGNAGEPATGGAEATGGAGAGGEGTGGTTSTAGIDDLIAAICGWEFGCCDAGETTYRLGTSGGTVDDCIDDFVFQLHQSNQTNNPYPPGTATGLLGTLGFTVNLDRVVENPAGIAECIEAWDAMGCSDTAEPATHCAASAIPGEGPCSLTNLFDPGLEIGDRCTLALTEGDGNDVECPAGTTCVDAGDPDNPETYPSCVQRGTDSDPCTNDGDCDWNFYCNAAGDCTEKGDEGDDCSFNDTADPQPDDEDAQCKAGLKCNPNSLTCVTNCSRNYPCTLDFECAEGDSCRPVTVGDDSTSWETCQAIGANATARCDDDADCVDERRCAGGVCQTDLSIGDDCTTDEECEVGSFCDTAQFSESGSTRTPTLQCTAYFNAGDPCFPGAISMGYSSGCNPATSPECVYIDGTWECTTSKRGEDDTCIPYSLTIVPDEPSDCAPGLQCEYSDTTIGTYSCTDGAGLGDDCDDSIGDDTALLCDEGLFCLTSGSGTPTCVEQVDPGSDCEDPNTNDAEDGLCRNGDCVEHWDGNGSFICTDAPVPVLNDGDGLTCNG